MSGSNIIGTPLDRGNRYALASGHPSAGQPQHPVRSPQASPTFNISNVNNGIIGNGNVVGNRVVQQQANPTYLNSFNQRSFNQGSLNTGSLNTGIYYPSLARGWKPSYSYHPAPSHPPVYGGHGYSQSGGSNNLGLWIAGVLGLATLIPAFTGQKRRDESHHDLQQQRIALLQKLLAGQTSSASASANAEASASARASSSSSTTHNTPRSQEPRQLDPPNTPSEPVEPSVPTTGTPTMQEAFHTASLISDPELTTFDGLTELITPEPGQVLNLYSEGTGSDALALNGRFGRPYLSADGTGDPNLYLLQAQTNVGPDGDYFYWDPRSEALPYRLVGDTRTEFALGERFIHEPTGVSAYYNDGRFEISDEAARILFERGQRGGHLNIRELVVTDPSELDSPGGVVGYTAETGTQYAGLNGTALDAELARRFEVDDLHTLQLGVPSRAAATWSPSTAPGTAPHTASNGSSSTSEATSNTRRMHSAY